MIVNHISICKHLFILWLTMLSHNRSNGQRVIVGIYMQESKLEGYVCHLKVNMNVYVFSDFNGI